MLAGRHASPFQYRDRRIAETVPAGIPSIDNLTGGLPRGSLTEICGPPCSGKTSFLISTLASRTAASEVCALVDARDAFDPRSAETAGVRLNQAGLGALQKRRSGSSRHGSADSRRRLRPDRARSQRHSAAPGSFRSASGVVPFSPGRGIYADDSSPSRSGAECEKLCLAGAAAANGGNNVVADIRQCRRRCLAAFAGAAARRLEKLCGDDSLQRQAAGIAPDFCEFS